MKFLLIAFFATAASEMLAPLYTSQEKIENSYIVVFQDKVDTRASVNKIENIPFFRSLGGRVDRVYGTALNGFAATMSSTVVEMVRRLDFVKYVQEDQVVRSSAVASWGLDRIDQRNSSLDNEYTLHDTNSTGKGVNVYVIDSGINYDHVAFEGRAEKGMDKDVSGDGTDCNGHGTHCAGTIGGDTYGVAKKASLVGVKVFGCNGAGSSSDVVAGINWVLANHAKPAVAVLPISTAADTSMDTAVKGLYDANVTVVVAAGNNNKDASDYSPGRAEGTITVGASDINDNRASFSNYGSSVDIFAPGVSITSCSHNSNTGSGTNSGTSMACSHAAGAAAIVLQKHPDDPPEEVLHHLISEASANKLTNIGAGSPNLLLFVDDLEHDHDEHDHEHGHEH